MAWDVLVQGGRVVLRDGVVAADVAVEDGVIVEVGAGLQGNAKETIDARGCHVMAGGVDVHVHFNEPGRAEWEGFRTGSGALVAGGGTSFVDMPLNSSPSLLDAAAFEAKREAGERSSLADFGLYGGLTPGNLDQMEALADCGVLGFKAFMCNSGIDDFAAADDATLEKGMKIAASRGLPVLVHAESEAMTAELTAAAVQAGKTGWRDYLATRPMAAEVDAVRRAVALAEETGCSLHVVHVSCVEATKVVLDAAKRGVDVTCETCPHYLVFDEEELVSMGAKLKCSPPVRAREEVARLREVLMSGGFTLVGSDHSPAPLSMKQGEDAFDIWGGIAGVQSTFGVMLNLSEVNYELDGERLSLSEVSALVSRQPAERFGLTKEGRGKGQIAVGFDADLVLVDLRDSYVLTEAMLKDRHRLSPYMGQRFQGVVKRTMVRGRTVFLDGDVMEDAAGWGRLIRKEGRDG